ncbi:hypothetical protein GEV33_013252 [Tenebrio molitor]|uniref:Uncharacterized protein n=1 Tax=Tenebrio molitor TaxID=7067 RepID=A0A8J6H7J2_TENMO|nr:hypothetical protein GEV33_013252 [Tenebrio molitor]
MSILLKFPRQSGGNWYQFLDTYGSGWRVNFGVIKRLLRFVECKNARSDWKVDDGFCCLFGGESELLFMGVEMQFKTRVSTLAARICIIHTETRQIPSSFHYNPIPVSIFHGKLNGVREMFTVSLSAIPLHLTYLPHLESNFLAITLKKTLTFRCVCESTPRYKGQFHCLNYLSDGDKAERMNGTRGQSQFAPNWRNEIWNGRGMDDLNGSPERRRRGSLLIDIIYEQLSIGDGSIYQLQWQFESPARGESSFESVPRNNELRRFHLPDAGVRPWTVRGGSREESGKPGENLHRDKWGPYRAYRPGTVQRLAEELNAYSHGFMVQFERSSVDNVPQESNGISLLHIDSRHLRNAH